MLLQVMTGLSNVLFDWPLIAAVLHTGGAAALVGVLFLGEALTGMQLVAFAIALASVLLATLPSRAALRVGRRGGNAS